MFESNFSSAGLKCAGTLYLPEPAEVKPAVVILAQGFCAEKSFRLPAFAERFREAGFAAYLFDYRCFGDSEGEPRHWVSPARHLADWRAALVHIWATAAVAYQCRDLRLRGQRHLFRDVLVHAAIVQSPYVERLAQPAALLGLATYHRGSSRNVAAGYHSEQGIRRTRMADRHCDRLGLGRILRCQLFHDADQAT